MNIRKIAVVGGMAAGAAFALAPLASADAPATPFDMTDTLNSEVASMNAIFAGEAGISGVGSHVTAGSGTFASANPWDTIPLTYAPNTGDTPTMLGYLMYGLDPIANASGDPGAYNIFNGATTEFDNAYNVALYALMDNNALLPTADMFGSAHVVGDAVAAGSSMGAFDVFMEAGVNDMLGYFDLPSITF